ncbi:MAG: hypothetical protein HY436_01010 [Candidatus Liptonbacteria bacterium]|nr:hypothetical protein [Candidatus Liptonbacteria bacterium]
MLAERTAKILETAMQEFIRTGEPVSSAGLFERYEFGIRPAMIRHELHELTERGYFIQPYHSAGRLPSDKGFEFLVERILSEETPAGSGNRMFAHLFRSARWDELLAHLAEELGVLGILEDMNEGRVYKEGLEDFVAHVEWDSPEELRDVIKDIAHIEDRMRAVRRAVRGELTVFIGKRSPLTASGNLAVVACEKEEGGAKVFLAAVGPKRMNYQKVIRIFQHL